MILIGLTQIKYHSILVSHQIFSQGADLRQFLKHLKFLRMIQSQDNHLLILIKYTETHSFRKDQSNN